MGKLTSKTVESLVKAAAPGKTNDGDGLYFQVSKTGGTSWIFRYKLEGRSREMGLGPYPTVTLSGSSSTGSRPTKDSRIWRRPTGDTRRRQGSETRSRTPGDGTPHDVRGSRS